VAGGLVVTLPMAVAQARRTQTDVMTACRRVLTCGFSYRLLTRPFRTGDSLLSALAFGLAAATRQTAALFGGAALLPAIGLLAWRDRRRAGGWIAAMALAVGAIAAGARPELDSVRRPQW
jgi:4-amino-4-deoxy-L-arabinose transferase-like glycosyltransferase